MPSTTYPHPEEARSAVSKDAYFVMQYLLFYTVTIFSQHPQPGFFNRNRRMPPGCSLASMRSQPVVRQKCSKSLVAPGSVARTSRMPPAGTAFSARRAFSTGNGHNSPVASSVVSGVVVPPSASPIVHLKDHRMLRELSSDRGAARQPAGSRGGSVAEIMRGAAPRLSNTGPATTPGDQRDIIRTKG